MEILIGLVDEMVQHQVVHLQLVCIKLILKIQEIFIFYLIILDHTLSSAHGHFLYIDPTGRTAGDEAHLISPSYAGGQPRCLRLWYHLYGAGQGTLQIQKKPEVGRAKTLWTKTNDQGKELDSFIYSFILFIIYF